MTKPDSKLKMFVNDPNLWGSFVEEVESRIAFCHKQLEQMDDSTALYRLQGEVKALKGMRSLRDKVNG